MGAIVVISSWDAAWPLLAPAARWARIACVGLYAAAQALLVLYSLHRCLLLWRRWRMRGRPRATPAPLVAWPRVTVQLPVYNERRVIERLIDAVARLDYPADRLEIQVLDDSSDETRTWAARAAARHAARGVDIRVLHRPHRAGYKAGALAHGMRGARGEFLAVFDSDFVPAPDFLRRALPHFADPGIGMVQARWGHLNRDASLLTAAQAVLLDSHFAIEHETRMRCGLFLNFNGSAGVWRRACIEAAGGWSHDTLTEDLDLSYRAQLAGWRFVYDDTIEAPAEPANPDLLPPMLKGFGAVPPLERRHVGRGRVQHNQLRHWCILNPANPNDTISAVRVTRSEDRSVESHSQLPRASISRPRCRDSRTWARPAGQTR